MEPVQEGNTLRRSLIPAAALLALGLTLSGCGSDSLDKSDTKGGDVQTSVDKGAAAKVPQAIKDKGTLTVGTDASYAPSEFLDADGKTIVDALKTPDARH